MKATKHLTEKALESYGARASSAVELLDAQAHVGACAECRARLERAVQTDAAWQSLRGQLSNDAFGIEEEAEHLPYEQLALYLDGGLDEVERELADSHLAICHLCTDDLADLQRYQVIAAAAVPSGARMALPATTETSVAAPANRAHERLKTSAESAGAKWWQRLFPFALSPSFNMLVPAGMAAAVVLLLLLVVWFAGRTNRGNDKSELAQSGKGERNSSASSQIESKPSGDMSVPTGNGKASELETSPPPASGMMPSTSPQNEKSPLPPRNNSSNGVTLRDGGAQLAFDGAGNLQGPASLTPSMREAVRRSVSTQRAPTPRLLETLTEGRAGVLMGSGAAGAATHEGVPFALISPVGKVTREAQPALRWQPLAGAKSYTVAVVDANFRVLAQSSNLTATEWKPAAPLPRGANYSWQVTALDATGAAIVAPVAPAPQAKFRVMDQTAFDEVTRMETSGVSSHLARGVIYAGAGLLDEARAEFTALVKANPRSTLARKLLDSVKK